MVRPVPKPKIKGRGRAPKAVTAKVTQASKRALAKLQAPEDPQSFEVLGEGD